METQLNNVISPQRPRRRRFTCMNIYQIHFQTYKYTWTFTYTHIYTITDGGTSKSNTYTCPWRWLAKITPYIHVNICVIVCSLLLTHSWTTSWRGSCSLVEQRNGNGLRWKYCKLTRNICPNARTKKRKIQKTIQDMARPGSSEPPKFEQPRSRTYRLRNVFAVSM